MALTQIDDRGLKTPIDLLDNEKIRLGTGNDLEIYYQGSYGLIDNTANTLYIKSAGGTYFQNSGSEAGLYIKNNGAVELYHDNVKKLETDSTGVTVTGNIKLGDNESLNIGASTDLKLYHDGTDNFIKAQGTGNTLRIFTTDGEIKLQSGASAGENMLVANADGAVELYHNNVKTFETASNGTIIRGTEANAGVIYLYADEGDDNADKWRHLSHPNGTYYLQNFASGSWEDNITAAGDGAVELYYDNVKKLETDANGVTITGQCATTSHVAWPDHSSGYVGKAVFGGGDDLQIYHDSGGDSYIQDKGSGHLYITGDDIILQNNDTSETLAKFIEDGGVELYHNNSKVFETLGNGVRAQGGIMFGSDTADANRITDYEEGTFDVTFSSGTAYANQNMLSYTKIGNLVHVQGQFRVLTVASGSLEINNLPFTVKSHTENEGYSPPAVYIYGIDLTADTKWVSGYVQPGGTKMIFIGNTDNGATDAVSGTADGWIMISLNYRAA